MAKKSTHRPLTKLLVANRGEIAVRIMRSARTLGMKTVAVYSDADAQAWHTTCADEAVHIGKAESRASYLNIDRIIAAAKKVGADSVHPGYGFLSENADFAKALAEAGIKLVGPSAKVIACMGDKIAAKKLAQKAGVPLVPGLTLGGKGDHVAAVTKFATEVGYPLIVKAASGGGGRGMRRITAAEDIPEAIAGAAREAEAFFSDGRIFIERLIEPARHIEVQIFGDSHGNVAIVGDRDCTWQRQHQKVIEEAPAPGLSPATRKKLHAAAKSLAAAAGYESAGTAEFLLDREGKFYFLEVNSRLQVEHPVTEAVTGLDLVALQLRIASGEKLTDLLQGRSLTPCGTALECRICAEAPEEGFTSSTGEIRSLDLPGGEHRFDTGYRIGDRVSHYYDSLLGKLIFSAPTREELIERAVAGLTEFSVTGIKTNVGFVLDLLKAQPFLDHTHTITSAKSYVGGGEASLTERRNELAALAVLVEIFHDRDCGDPDEVWNRRNGFRVFGSATIASSFRIYGTVVSVRGTFIDHSTLELYAGDEKRPRQFSTVSSCCGELVYTSGNIQHYHKIDLVDDQQFWIKSDWGDVLIQRVQPSLKQKQVGAGAAMRERELRAPLPGKIIAVKVAPGEAVVSGAVLLVLESMKMEHPIRASHDGVIQKINVSSGQIIEQGTVVAEIE